MCIYIETIYRNDLVSNCFYALQGQGVIKPIACRPSMVSSTNTTPILGARSSLALHHNSSMSDLRLVNSAIKPLALQQEKQQQQQQQQQQQLQQRLSWSKTGDASPSIRPLTVRQSDVGSYSLPPQSLSQTMPLPQMTNSMTRNSTTTASNSNTSNGGGGGGGGGGVGGRVADLSRKFGGSLCSIAGPPNSPTLANATTARQPPAYRPPPARIHSGEWAFRHWSEREGAAHVRAFFDRSRNMKR